jgi:hypothetical protein
MYRLHHQVNQRLVRSLNVPQKSIRIGQLSKKLFDLLLINRVSLIGKRQKNSDGIHRSLDLIDQEQEEDPAVKK